MTQCAAARLRLCGLVMISSILSLLAQGVGAMGWLPEVETRPEPPVIMRDVHRIDDDFRFTRPHIPGNRTSMDGRIAMVVQGGLGPSPRSYFFSLHVPERLQSPVMTGPAGAGILGNNPQWVVPIPPEVKWGAPIQSNHHTICDATPEFLTEGEKPNPYSCGANGENDCYDLTIVSSGSELLSTTLWGIPTRVEVANPKTADARIVDITMDTPVQGPTLTIAPSFLEPAVTEDGRLLTGRLGGFPRPWTNPNTGLTMVYGHDLVYSVLPEDAEPCDVTGWRKVHPMSHAPFDPDMKGKYGLAAYPFRDTEGKPIRDGDDMGGTYPWVDRQGDNVFMTGMGGGIDEADKERFPRRCAQAGANCEGYVPPKDYDRGFMVGGAWTHGKFVLLDAEINHVDWGVAVVPQGHYSVDLYQDAAGQDVSVRVGAGRFTNTPEGVPTGTVSPMPPGYNYNPNILDSAQNMYNYHANFRTLTPRDVVWLMSTGVATDEVVFDDYLYFDAFIVSNMQASISQGPINIMTGRTPHYRDGNERSLFNGINPAFIPLAGPVLTGNQEVMHIQNAATSPEWDVPAYGHVPTNQGRVEPVGLGGIKGKGFWLNGKNRITYAVPAQSRKNINDFPWYISLFVDPRLEVADGTPLTLMSFPDQTAIRVVSAGGSVQRVQYVDEGQVVADIDIGSRSGWRHLALQMQPGNRDVTLLVDGFALDRQTFRDPLFRMKRGNLVLGGTGDTASSFRGWIDEFKVLAMAHSPETACNHAHGTLAAINDHPDWLARSSAYPQWAHDRVSAQVGAAAADSGRYACFHDYTRDFGAHLANIPAGMRSVREAINFPEGPLRYGQPRPDSTDNAFCVRCHHDEGKRGLTMDALAWRPVNAEDDLRRQPSQPPQRVFGNIPAGWIAPGPGPGGPAAPMVAPPEGVKIDQWVLPR